MDFWAGPAPSLQHLCLQAIAFPELPTLLLSPRDLISLELEYTPPIGYG